MYHAPMTPAQLLETVRIYEKSFRERTGTSARFPSDQLLGRATWAKFHKHILWMTEQVPKLIDEGKIEKSMRWLGFIQGALWARGLVSIGDLRAQNGKDP